MTCKSWLTVPCLELGTNGLQDVLSDKCRKYHLFMPGLRNYERPRTMRARLQISCTNLRRSGVLRKWLDGGMLKLMPSKGRSGWHSLKQKPRRPVATGRAFGPGVVTRCRLAKQS